MMNRVTVTIAGLDYVLMAGEEESYMHRAAQHVDEKIAEVQASGASALGSAVLAALNVTDEYFKALDTVENLRSQLKEFVEESQRMRAEIGELRRETARLRKEGRG